ncbi:MAG: hypothetical protein KA923_08460 [Opitutaceae bacterium]|nr:hypothetical protein [Opitutaceae bacterium]
MNKLLLASLVGFTCAPAFVAAQSSSDATPPPVNVIVTSEATELARGYAAAFAQIKGIPVHLVLQKEGKPYTLTDVKSVKAAGGVLVVETGRGLTYLVNAKDVVWITDVSVGKTTSGQ